MISVGRELQNVKGVHALDTVSTEQAGDVVTKKEMEQAFKVLDRIKRLREIQMKTGLEVGESLKNVRDNRWYKIYGYDSFESWISSPEIDIDKSSAYRYIKILEVYVLTGAFTKDELYDKGVSKLEILIPYVTPDEKGWGKRKKEIEGMLELSRVDLTIHLNEKLNDDRYTPERPSKVLTKGSVTDAQFEDISDAKKKSKEVTSSLHKQMAEQADAQFNAATKGQKASVETMKIVSTSDVKKELGLGGWYKLVAVDAEEAKGKSFKGITLHIAHAMKKGGDVFIDIE